MSATDANRAGRRTLPAAELALVHDLYHRYCHYFDEGDAEQYAALFTADGEFQRPGEQPPLKGRGELIALARARREGTPGIRHFVTNIVVDETPSGARGSAYTFVLRKGSDGLLRFLSAGIYRDELVKDDGEWRFRRREYDQWIDPTQIDQPFAVATSA